MKRNPKKYRITATSMGMETSRVSSVRYTHAICIENGHAVFWSQSRGAAEAKARTNYIIRNAKHVIETLIEEIG